MMRVLLVLALVAAVGYAHPWQHSHADLALSNDLKEIGISQDALRMIMNRKEEILKQIRELEELALEVEKNADPRLLEDAILTTPELIAKYGYPAESHEIITEDGYILTYHRIPYGKNSATKVPNPRPLLLMHGLTSSSDDWIVPGPEKALGYILADAGYDVWIGNTRGNKWSRRHVSLDPKNNDFWTFSWHEMGVYDIPAAIDYVLNNTGKDSLHYVGHSMGTTMFTVMASARPEYNEKIRAAALLAPAVFFEYKEDGLVKYLTQYIHQIDILSEILGINDIMKHHHIYSVVADRYCQDSSPNQTLCLAAVDMYGINVEQLNKTILPVLLAHFPSGAATKNYFHYGQSINTGEFRLYDYGEKKNLLVYGDTKPPKYDISKVTAPVVIHYAQNDGTVTAEDAATLASLLPNLIDFNKVPNEKFNHADFVIAMQAKELVYDLLISQLEKY